MKLKHVLLAAMSVVGLVSQAPAQTVPGLTSDTIRIGIFAPLSGPVMAYGFDPVNGAKMYYDKINREGGINGRKVELVVKDDRCNANDLVAAVKDLVEREKVREYAKAVKNTDPAYLSDEAAAELGYRGVVAPLKFISVFSYTAQLAMFESAGVELIDPSCGACIKAGPGVSFTPDEVTVSAINRNFPGRMGHKESQVFLASPATVGASALAGKIVDPREYLPS